MTDTNFGSFNTDDPNQQIGISPRSPTIQQLQNSNFLPTFVNTPDQGMQFQSISTPSSKAAVANQPGAVTLNRVSVGLDQQPFPNPGSVEAGNVEITTFTPNTVDTSNNILKTFIPNCLDSYDNVTYNFKLALAPETQLLDPSTDPIGPFYIVAQSGVTSNFYIKNVDIESVVSPNKKTRNIKSTLFSITIVEPQGVSLIDKLVAAGAALNIKNIKTVPMILELTFKGYQKNGLATEVTIAKRTWRIQTQDIQTSMNEGGSEYVMNFSILSDHAFNRFSYAAIIQQQLTIPVDTVGQFFADLGYYLTLQATRVASQGQVARSEYVFNIDPTMAKWKIGQVAEQKNAPSQFIDVNGKRNFVVSTNKTIDMIVDLILSTTKEGNQMINPDSNPEKMDQDPSAPKVVQVGHISGKVEVIGFNPQANDYIRKYTYYITKQDNFRALIDKPNQQNSNRIQYLVQDALKKKYQYIFTGQNTDVLNLDLSLNALWTHATTYYANALQRKANTNSNFIKRTNTTTTPDDLRDKTTTSKYAFTPIPGNQPDALQNVVSPGGLQQNSTPAPATLPSLNPQTANISALDQLSTNSVVQRDALQQAIAQQDAITNSVPVQAASANGPQNLPVLSGPATRINGPIQQSQSTNLGVIASNGNISGTAIETLDNNPTLSNNEQDKILLYYSKQVDPSIDPRRVTENIEETTDLGRSIFVTVMDQLYQDSADTNLQRIELEIRGDPFWLGESDTEMYNRLESHQIGQPVNSNFANYLHGEHCFFLTFKTPKTYDQSTGFVNSQTADLFVGVYAVQKVSHSFSNGKFVQKLLAIRDLQTNAKTLAQYIK